MIVYRLLVSLFALFALPAALRRGGVALLRARLGGGGAPTPGPHLWWHGASNGELASARPVLDALLQARRDLHVVLTANSATGLDLARGWALERVTVRPAPLDPAWVTRRFIRRWGVIAHVTLESELWPNRVRLCPGPVIVLGARMTERTARGWARLPRLAADLTGRLDFVSAQDAASAERLSALGLPPAARGPVADLKALYMPPQPMIPQALKDAFPRAQTWLAASTHDGEEAIVLDAHEAARATDPALRLILAPRHAARGDAVEALITARGFSVARRSRDPAPGNADVYLADTMGEMPLWYALAGRVFVGGTLVARGGHTPYEPAAFGAALLHGPDVTNFAAPFARLKGIAISVHDARSLAAGLSALAPPERQRDAGQRAADALRAETGVDGLVREIVNRLPPVS
ncbi:3-deoxy-D-manno-octulosonic acid transferase [Citreimonas salinaria]|uniref:3-deoxy-D-manno-octulosonic acid transferase n=1 Tax=Citreimonas salinaria TaxID=321339 RepID=A0A1H3MKD9_9RHOB|nr:glycosyltransferase N-terminal domain-containing protein [Citreimonas salinaria]SDY77053.1 3-deoxy-D-manno-octulosonic-acid transferase [Citreimonas salinaria]